MLLISASGSACVLCLLVSLSLLISLSVFFNDTATPEIYTLSLHDALPIFSSLKYWSSGKLAPSSRKIFSEMAVSTAVTRVRSEEHTSELQSHSDLVCRLLLEKKK